MAFPKQALTAVICLVGLYVLYVQPFATALATLGLTFIVYAVSGSKEFVLALLVGSLFIKDINRLIAPKRMEPFQEKGPASVHTRVEAVKQKAPLAPPVENVTGVLESANILDSATLTPMETLAKEGVPGASIPASAQARVLIHPPSELTVGRPNGSVNVNPVANPFLQNGEDSAGVETSLFERGTDGMDKYASLSNLTGADTSAKPF